tara:strand:+ start:6949 stop:7230 length:282 start_codon:yes stop_codon:yes gene_type:complete
MALDHEAILRAYPNAVVVDAKVGVLDSSGDQITLDQNLVDAARVELDKEFYKIQRRREYPDWRTQLEYIYDNGIEKWKTDIVDPVKAKYPKPS